MKKYLLFVGIDISKKWIDVSLTLNGKKDLMLHHRFGNSKTGFSKMVKFIKSSSFFKSIPKARLQNCLFCMEHTGVYALPLSRFLQGRKIPFHLVSPHHLKWSLGLRRGKNDKADSKDIARYIFLNQQEVESLTIANCVFQSKGRCLKCDTLYTLDWTANVCIKCDNVYLGFLDKCTETTGSRISANLSDKPLQEYSLENGNNTGILKDKNIFTFLNGQEMKD